MKSALTALCLVLLPHLAAAEALVTKTYGGQVTVSQNLTAKQCKEIAERLTRLPDGVTPNMICPLAGPDGSKEWRCAGVNPGGPKYEVQPGDIQMAQCAK